MLRTVIFMLFLFAGTLKAADSLWIVVDTVNHPGLIITAFIEQPQWEDYYPSTGKSVVIEGKVYEIKGEKKRVLKGRTLSPPDSLGNKRVIDWQMQAHSERIEIVVIQDTMPLIKGPDGQFEDIRCRTWLSKDGKNILLKSDNPMKQ